MQSQDLDFSSCEAFINFVCPCWCFSNTQKATIFISHIKLWKDFNKLHQDSRCIICCIRCFV